MAKGSALRRPANDTSSDEFAALLDESLGGSTSFEGTVVKGTIVRIANDFVTIDVGLKSEGRVALREFASGGGARNPYVVDCLEKHLSGIAIKNTAELGIDPDAKEAILFALLGNEALCGEPVVIGDNPAVLMGKFSFSM